MAIYKEIKTESWKVAIWQINEDLSQLKTLLNNPEILEKIEKSSNNVKRQTEQIIAHLVIKHLTGEVKEIMHHPNGAPYIKCREGEFISISHSRKSIAVAISKKPIGIDIEEIDRKQYSLHKRFTTPNEQLWIEGSNNKQLISAIIWSAKEAIYKLANIEGLLFESEIEITPFNPTKESNFKANYRGIEVSCQLSVIGNQILVVSY